MVGATVPSQRGSTLHDLGWNDALQQSRLAYVADLVPARVVAEHRDLYRVCAGLDLAEVRPTPSHAVHGIRAVTFDFFHTLVHHRRGDGGRGRALVEYLRSVGIEPRPWQHQILYDVLEPHAREYAPELPADAKQAYLVRLARRVFERLDVSAAVHSPSDHATRIWELIGPRSLKLFPEVRSALTDLRAMGYRLAVISNWQCGLAHFCVELGIGEYFDHILASAEIGHAKPSPAIFEAASSGLGLAPTEILHVGDSVADDLEGARAAGFNTILLDREGNRAEGAGRVVRSLSAIPNLLETWPG